MAETGQNTTTQLGCGTLILIAIIVALFSGRNDVAKVREDISALREQVTRLEEKVDSMTGRLNETAEP